MVRLYFHLAPDGAPVLVSAVSQAFNRFHIPFALKCLTDPNHFDRADAVVLYIANRYVPITLRLIAETAKPLHSYFRRGVPLFTKELRPGLAAADDPGMGISFGQTRCRLLAQGIVEAWHNGRQDSASELQAVAERFTDANMSLARPYLGPGRIDPFQIEDGVEIVERSSVAQSPDSGHFVRAAKDNSFLWAADRIACRLCRDAIWADGKCNWVAWSMEPQGAGVALGYRSLPARLYDGLAGVALFLARLANQMGERMFRRATFGALGQLRVMATQLANDSWGYFTGLAGIGHVFVQIGELEGNEFLIHEGLELIRQCCGRPVDQGNLDFFTGCAGVIPVLLDLGRRYERSAFLEGARRYAGELLLSATEQNGAVSWPTNYTRTKNLVGLADGTTGILCALADCLAAAPNQQLRETMIKALWYERNAFDAEVNNWPDYRRQPNTSAAKPAYPVACSHGAAGIGLARLHLLRLFGPDAAIMQDLETAIRTSRRALVQPLALDGENFTPFHGRAGIAEFLLQAGEQLNRSDLKETAYDLGRIGIDAFDRNGLPWPCGLPQGKECPGLLTGVAGIGHFYLRLHNPAAVPPIWTL